VVRPGDTPNTKIDDALAGRTSATLGSATKILAAGPGSTTTLPDPASSAIGRAASGCGSVTVCDPAGADAGGVIGTSDGAGPSASAGVPIKPANTTIIAMPARLAFLRIRT
jgi:hypothetical protein